MFTVRHGTAAPNTLYQASDFAISSNWDLIEDPESGIREYEVALSRSDSLSDAVTPFVRIGTSRIALVDVRAVVGATVTALQHGERYFTHVRTTNRVGLQSLSVSVAVEIDLTPPHCTVLDGVELGVDAALVTDDKLGFQWDCDDEESAVVSVQYGVGSTQGGSNILPLREHESPAAVLLLDDFTVVPGTRYFILIVATNGAGVSAAFASNGAINDHTEPEVVFIDNGGPYVTGSPTA